MFVKVGKWNHRGIEFAGTVGSYGRNWSKVSAVSRDEDDVFEAVFVERSAVRPDHVH